MMQRIVIGALAMLVCFGMLAACGPVASDTTTTTMTTIETTTTTMEASQDNNRPLCVGLLNLGSCNVVTVQTQAVHGRTAGAQAPTPDNGMSGAEMIGLLVLLCLAFIFVVGAAGMVMGSGGYN